MCRSSFVFGLGSKLCLFIFFPASNVRSSKNCKVATYMKKSRPEYKSHSPTPATLGKPKFPTFPYGNLAFNTLETNSGLERFFDGKVTFLAKPGKLGQGERIRPSASLFSALGSGKGVNCLSYKPCLS